MRCSALQEHSDHGWTQIGPLKQWTKALFITLFARCLLELRVRHLIALDNRLYHQADEPEELKDFDKGLTEQL